MGGSSRTRFVGVAGRPGYRGRMDALETPRELAAVDAAWIDGALRGANVIHGPRIEKIAVEKIGESNGFLGEIGRVHLDDANPGSPASVIVKLPTGNRRLRAVAESMGLYEREILFYTQLAPRLPLRLPRCYFAQLDRGVAAPQMNPRFVAWVNRMPPWVRSAGISRPGNCSSSAFAFTAAAATATAAAGATPRKAASPAGSIASAISPTVAGGGGVAAALGAGAAPDKHAFVARPRPRC